MLIYLNTYFNTLCTVGGTVCVGLAYVILLLVCVTVGIDFEISKAYGIPSFFCSVSHANGSDVSYHPLTLPPRFIL